MPALVEQVKGLVKEVERLEAKCNHEKATEKKAGTDQIKIIKEEHNKNISDASHPNKGLRRNQQHP